MPTLSSSFCREFASDELVRLLKTIVWGPKRIREEEMLKLHFHPFEKKGMPGTEVWMNHCLGVVVKNAFFFTDDPPKALKCPTIFLTDDDSGPVHREWVCQPIVDRKRRALALEAIKARLSRPERYDLHSGQCGHLNGKPVLFDW